MSSPTVNRCLSDPAMDDIDQALGRPLDPLAEADRAEQDAVVGALLSIIEAGAQRGARDAARPRLGNLTAAGRYAEALRKARLKCRRDARSLPYHPCFADYERQALIDAIEKAYADGCAAGSETKP